MAKTASSYSFSHVELVTLMLKEAGIHEGMWQLNVNFRLGAGTFGFTPTEFAPAALVTVEALMIAEFDPQPDMPVPSLVFDAKKLNPKP